LNRPDATLLFIVVGDSFVRFEDQNEGSQPLARRAAGGSASCRRAIPAEFLRPHDPDENERVSLCAARQRPSHSGQIAMPIFGNSGSRLKTVSKAARAEISSVDGAVSIQRVS